LCISLHAHSDEQRDSIMPVNRRLPIAQVLKAAKEYAQATGRRVIIEYALIEGVNDTEADAAALSDRLRGLNCHVNLIPLNPVPERQLQGPAGSGPPSLPNGWKRGAFPPPYGANWARIS
jgi:23S rRNA (adenine2503-C2)-methyltransferase